MPDHTDTRQAAMAPRLPELITAFCAEIHPCAPAPAVTPDSRFNSDFGLGSLARSELLSRIEKTFHGHFPLELFSSAATPADVLRVLAARGNASMSMPQAPAGLAPPSDQLDPPARADARRSTALACNAAAIAKAHRVRRRPVARADLDLRIAVSVRAPCRAWPARTRRRAGRYGCTDAADRPRLFRLLRGHPVRRSGCGAGVSTRAGGPARRPPAPACRDPRECSGAHDDRAGGRRNGRGAGQGVGAGVGTSDRTGRADGTRDRGVVRGARCRRRFSTIHVGQHGHAEGVVLTHANLPANIHTMGRTIGVDRHDVFASWLPLYHDMGLIG